MPIRLGSGDMKLLHVVKKLRPFSRRSPETPRLKRETISWWVAVFTAGVLMLAVGYAADTRLFMPGPITSAHSTLGKCSDCHSGVSAGKFSWVHAIFAPANPDKDSSSCLTCHKMGEGAKQPHGMEVAKLDAYMRKIRSEATGKPLPIASRVRKAVLPVDSTFRDGVFCATCHKEHQGENIPLKAMADAQCHTCHSVQFDSFNSDHPKFANYPFRRRTRINFDHSSHFKKHFPEWKTKKANSGETPGICADCHTASPENGHMSVKPFATSCSACHVGQIVGVERATGPKGIALLSVPGIDVATLSEKLVLIGNWPDEAEGEMGPLMKLLIGRTAEGKKVLEATKDLDLLDLTTATPEQIVQVEKLAWEVKGLFHALANSGTADVMKQLDSGGEMAVGEDLLRNLNASMPRDVLVGALREWLPNLAEEIEQKSESKQAATPVVSVTASSSDAPASIAIDEIRVAQAEVSTSQRGDVVIPRQKPARQNSVGPVVIGQSERWRVDAFGRLIKGNRLPEEDEDDEETSGQPDDTDDETPEEAAEDSDDQASDETEEVAADSDADSEASEQPASDVAQIELDTDAETWTQFGGWYRQDYSILYKPTGHADPFMKAWLEFSAGRFSKAEGNLAASVFNELTGKDAQGQCTKCHSVDATKDEKRLMKWTPSSIVTRESLFTKFNHEPHLGVATEKGCLTCHKMSGAKGYQDTYKGNDPDRFVSNFAPVKKETCASCHGKEQVRQDCLLCHKYHVNGIVTPILQTRIPDK